MLTNLIGVAMAFITVMLMLSLVAMALVQLTQAVLRLRGRNLLVGIAALVASEERLKDNLEAPTSKRRLSPKVHTDHAAEILNRTTAARLRPVEDPNSPMNILRGPATSWADPEDIAAAILARHKPKGQLVAAAPAGASVGGPPVSMTSLPGGEHALNDLADELPPADVKTLAAKFRSLEPGMSDRFARTMQMWTAIWGLVVAILFQVNAPALLRMLSTSEAKRDAVMAMVPGILNQAQSSIPSAMSDDFVDRALAQLAADPVVNTRADAADIKAVFEQVSGSTDSRQEMVDDLRAVLAGVNNKDAIVRRYGEIIDTTATHDIGAAIATATASADSLGAIEVTPWRQGAAFYASGTNILGVLFTAILLSFGAPFWFDQLKNVASLRDALSRKPADAKA